MRRQQMQLEEPTMPVAAPGQKEYGNRRCSCTSWGSAFFLSFFVLRSLVAVNKLLVLDLGQ